ncbi:hypothetical protein HanPSC8_Chr05g0216481 [Helianthus annuus]|nr:hypothetical protein HanPSC8_Chr05g0216481 [Helianthus annuus]
MRLVMFLIDGHLLIGCCFLIFSKSLHFAQWLLSIGNTKWLYCCSKDAWKYTTMKHDEYSLSYLSKSLLWFSHHHRSRHIYLYGLQMDFHDTGSGPSSWINRGLWFHYGFLEWKMEVSLQIYAKGRKT